MSIQTSIAPINISTNTSTAPIVSISPIQPIKSLMQSSKLNTDLGKLDNIPTPTTKQDIEVKEAKQAIELLPISTLKIDEIKSIIDEIDIRDPNSLQIITPTNIVNYVDHVYGHVDIEILEPDALSISQPSNIDVSTLPIDLGRKTSLDFIAFDPGMAFLASNGTSPENIVIAENMVAEETGFPVLLSLNDNSEQNLQLIQSSDTQTIGLSVDIPLGLDAVEFSDFIADISSRTDTLQIISPDLVTETSYDPQIQMTEFAILANNKGQSKSLSSKPISNIKKFFGDLTGLEIRQILDNPQINPKFAPLTTINDGSFFLVMHGEIASSELEDYDCRDFDRIGFIGRQGLILVLSPERITKFLLDIKPKSQRLVGDVCKLPKLLYKPEKDIINHNMFGLSHIDSKGNVQVVLNNYDLVQIYGNGDAYLHSVLNLVRIISGGSKNINLNIGSCLAASEDLRSKKLTDFRIGNSERDIPRLFQYWPKDYKQLDAPRVQGRAPDRFCRLGANALRDDAGAKCSEFIASELAKNRNLDPNIGLSGDGIRTALNSDMIINVHVLFEVEYSFNKNPLVYYLSDNIIPLKGFHYLILKYWYDENNLDNELFKSQEFKDLGLKQTITITYMLPEIIEVFDSFKQVDDITFPLFKSRLIAKLQINKLKINARIK